MISRRDFLKGAAAGALSVAALGSMGFAAQSDVKTATATAGGFGGDVHVTLSVRDGVIVDCSIVGDSETPAVGGHAIEVMPARYIEAGNLEVEGVAGATFTSTAIKNAAAQAYNSCMGLAIGEVRMKPGRYTANALGYWGIWELPVTITVNETSLLNIEVPEDRYAHGETEVMLNCVKEKLFPRMIQHQSVSIDAIAGCTATSNAVKMAAEQALKEALAAGGSDESAIANFYNNPPQTEEGLVEEFDADFVFVGMAAAGLFSAKRALETFISLSGGQKRIKIWGIEKCGKIGGQSCLTHEANGVNPPKLAAELNNGEDFVDAQEYYDTWSNYTKGADGSQNAKLGLLDLYFRESGNAIDWLAYKQGYMMGTPTGKHDFSTATFVTTFNYFGTNRTDKYLESYEDRRNVVDRYYKKIATEIQSAGGGYLLETEAYEYLYDAAENRVTGVKARNLVTGKEYIIHAPVVVSSTGGFGQSQELMNSLLAPNLRGMWKQNGNHCNNGTFFKAGLDIGAGTWNADMAPICMEIGLPTFLKHFPINFKEGQITGRTGRQSTWTYNDIPLYLCCSIDSMAIGPDGRRVCNEYGISNGLGENCPPDTWVAGPYFYSIWSQAQIDSLADAGFSSANVLRTAAYVQQGGFNLDEPLGDIMQEAMDASVEEGLAWKGETLAELAAQINVDATVLEETVARYNGFCESGVDEDFGKDAQYLKALGEGPYYAIKAMNVMYGTGGGFDVNENMQVLKADHETPIQGMYALGQDSFGVIQNNEKNYCGYGGPCQGWQLLSGYISGKHAAEYVYENFGLVSDRS